MKTRLPLLRGTGHSNLDYIDKLPVNYIAVIKDIKGDAGYLLTHDGVDQFAEVSGIARGGYFNERFQKHFRVSGESLEEIGTDGSVKVIGLIPGREPCQFFSSFNTQAILADGRLFLYDNSSLEEVKDPDFGFAISGTWFRGVYVFTDGQNIFETKVTDEYAFEGLSYVTSEFSNDPTQAVAQTENNQVVAFNRTSTEWFYFNPNNPVGTSVLSAVQGKSVKVGICGPNCKAEMSGYYFCLGSRPNESNMFYVMASSGQIEKISTSHIDSLLENYTQTQLYNVYMETRVNDGSKLLIVHLPDLTLVYNHSVGAKFGADSAWSIVKSGVNEDPWRCKFGVLDQRTGKWIYGDTKESKLGVLVSDKASQYGEPVESICYTPINYLEGNIVLQSITFQSIPGFSGEPIDVFYSFSDDGVVYGRESSMKISSQHKYKRYVKARSNGLFKDLLAIKLRMISHYKEAVSGLEAEYRHRGQS